MSIFLSWLFHRVRTRVPGARTGAGSREATRALGSLRGEAEPEPREASLTTEGSIGSTQLSGGPLFMGLEALVHRESALLDGLTPIPELAALISFVGLGITDPNQYADGASAFSQLPLKSPAHEGALIQVFRQQLLDESQGSDFLYIHFIGDPLAFGFLICTLSGGGLMAGWKLS